MNQVSSNIVLFTKADDDEFRRARARLLLAVAKEAFGSRAFNGPGFVLGSSGLRVQTEIPFEMGDLDELERAGYLVNHLGGMCQISDKGLQWLETGASQDPLGQSSPRFQLPAGTPVPRWAAVLK